MNSFHAVMKAKSAVTAIAGRAAGSTTRRKACEARRAVDHRGLLELDGDRVEGAAELEDRERDRGRRVDEDEAGARVEQVERVEEQVERDGARDARGTSASRGARATPRALADEVEARERVGRGRRDRRRRRPPSRARRRASSRAGARRASARRRARRTPTTTREVVERRRRAGSGARRRRRRARAGESAIVTTHSTG